jgi:hypothetical protein
VLNFYVSINANFQQHKCTLIFIKKGNFKKKQGKTISIDNIKQKGSERGRSSSAGLGVLDEPLS